jgi:glycosyltransferase involved in cell wall biosynthesis
MPLRILLTSCNPNDPAIELPMFLALKNLGYEVRTCDATHKPFGSRLLFRICRRLFKSRSSYLWNKLLQVSGWFTRIRVLRAARVFKPDVFIAIKAKEVDAGTVKKLRDMGIITANWYMEGLWHQSVFILSPAYDYFFVMDEYSVSVLREQGIKSAHYLAYGTRLTPAQVSNTYERIYDVSFVGTPIPIREKIFGILNDFNLNLWGPTMWEKTALKKFYRGRAYGADLDNIYQRSKIVINTNAPYEKTTGPNLRNFEAMGNGALLICDFKPGLAELLTENKELIFYRDINELPSLVSYYLKNDEERSAIAKAGQMAVLANHTIESRVRDMMEVIKTSLKTVNG